MTRKPSGRTLRCWSLLGAEYTGFRAENELRDFPIIKAYCPTAPHTGCVSYRSTYSLTTIVADS